MSDVTATPETPAAPDSRSSIFEKTTPELRRKLERAILNYDSASYLAIFKKYDLPSHGVSYTSFYCYARKLRGRASVQQALDLDGPDDDQFRITPEERRRRELHRVLINFNLLKPDAALPDSS